MSRIEPPTSSQNIGTFNNVTYVRHKGRFTGKTVEGNFAVPYEITSPSNFADRNATVVFEPPHFTSGPIARDVVLGPAFLFNRSLRHASVGYSNVGQRILNPAPGFTPIIQGKEIKVIPPGAPGEITDCNILRQFAQTLRESTPPFLGRVEKIYGIGFSDSGNTVQHVYGLFGHKLFDISFPCTAPYHPPVKPAGANPIIVFNAESDFDVETVPDPAFTNYRWYAVAGGPHIPDNPLTRTVFNEEPPPPHPGFNPPAPPLIAGTTPLNWVPFIKALFVAGHEWVSNRTQPPASAVLKVGPRGLLARDEVCNAIGGIRHPALELKEATFIASVARGRRWELFGGYSGLRTFSNFDTYKELFRNATENLVKARFLLKAAASVLNHRATLQPPATYTINYFWERFYATPPPTDEDAFMP